MFKRLSYLVLTLLLSLYVFAVQDPRLIKVLNAIAGELGKEDHGMELVLTSSSRTSSGAEVIYGHQTVQGLEVVHTHFNAVFSAEKLVKVNRNLYPFAERFISTLTAAYSLEAAVQKAMQDQPMQAQLGRSINANTYLYSDPSTYGEAVVATRKWMMVDGTLHPIAELSLMAKDHSSCIQYRIDLLDGSVLETRDLVLHCSFDKDHTHSTSGMVHLPDLHDTHKEAGTQQAHANSSYEVFPYPVESPNHGIRAVVTDPDDSLASPFGWHDVNGASGAEYTITRGNNVFAGDDKNNDDIPENSPDGGASLHFSADFDKTKAASLYTDAAVINLFYWNNMMHDVWYHYGFDEASGNFQENNYGRGGIGGDAISAQAQDGSGTNNANFYTSGDGNLARIQMYIWNSGGNSSDYIQVNSPASAQGKYVSSRAVFGPQLTSNPINGDLVVADPLRACGDLGNATQMNGKIALIQRGGCTFVEKVRFAQAAGAVAAVIYDSMAGNPILMGGTGSDIGIPSVMIRNSDGLFLKNLVSGGVSVSLYDSSTLGQSTVFDSDFDAGIIAHEYGHGISIRLAGGPSTGGCLGGAEQMGEGWSDFFALVMTQQPYHQGTDQRGVGTYVTNQDTSGTGIRTWAYSTNINSSPYNYDHIKQLSVPHGVGSVWCAMLWDLYWAFIDEYGYDPDLYTGTGGNNMVMQLVIDGLKLQPCGPGFIDGRDAILLADKLKNNSKNERLIWSVFARRGLGYSAVQGSAANRGDGSMGFDLPPYLENRLKISKKAVSSAPNGEQIAYELMAANLTASTIYDINLLDTLDPGLRLKDTAFDCGSRMDRVWSMHLDSLEAGDTFLCVIRPRAQFATTTVSLSFEDMENGKGDWQLISDVGQVGWTLTTSKAHSGNTSWYVRNVSNEQDHSLVKEYSVSGERPVLSFYHYFDTEAGWDGGVVEVLNGITWVDAQPYFVLNGYNSTIQTNQASTISGRRAFSGNSNGWKQSRIDLSAFKGQTVKVRFRFASDAAANEDGWYVDDVSLDDALLVNNTLVVTHAPDARLQETVSTLITGDGVTVGVQELKTGAAFGVQVQPNPASSIVWLEWNEGRVERIQLLDLHGQLIRERSVNGSTAVEWNVEGLAAGSYVFRLIGKEGVVSRPIVIQ